MYESLDRGKIDAFSRGLVEFTDRKIKIEQLTRDYFPLDDIKADVDRWHDVIQEGRGLLILTGFPVDQFSKEDCGAIFYGLGSYFGEAQVFFLAYFADLQDL